MCGIVGATTKTEIGHQLLNTLKLLEYRGYDSAGISLMSPSQTITTIKACGKIERLKEQFSQSKQTQGCVGIAHTRWATHGKPSEVNAHPFCSNDSVSIVHNGIIENANKLKSQLETDYHFQSETDSEVIAHLFHQKLACHHDPITALHQTSKELTGSYATAILSDQHPNKIFFSCHNSPLVIAITEQGHFLASDHLALAGITNQFIYLESHQHGYISQDNIALFSPKGEPIEPVVKTINISERKYCSLEYDHFMIKEIYEQKAIIQHQIDRSHQSIAPPLESALKQAESIVIIGCGSSYNAGLIAKYWLESVSNISVSVEIASEHRYKRNHYSTNTLIITLSQSGETADTIAALKEVTRTHPKIKSLCISNNQESSLVRQSDFHIIIPAGPEIGVASTKAFTSTLLELYHLSVFLGEQNDQTPSLPHANDLPSYIERTLSLSNIIQSYASAIASFRHILFIGRHSHYPVAIEGALKLKEISYIHAEAYAGGELKHGPLALIDEQVATIAILVQNHLYEKMISNINEILSRGGRIFLITNSYHIPFDNNDRITSINLPPCEPSLMPFVTTIALQLLAYHTAVYKQLNVDQPRNLAKCVTVE